MRDFHVHTTFSDGANTPEEMVQAAIKLGMEAIGFSDHAYTPFDESYCIPLGRMDEYRRTIAALKEQYAGKIQIYCGIEQDLYATSSTAGFDYVIGSVHYVRAGSEYLPVDESAEVQKQAVARHFGGDFYAFAERYFEAVAQLPEQTGASLLGHLDLVAKFNQREQLFDERHPRYVRAWQQAVDTLLMHGIPFEINTGAISRGYRTLPYPNPDMQAYIRAHGGQFVYSSDSHRADTLCYGFAEK